MGIRGNKQSAVLTDSILVFVGGFLGTIFRYFLQKAANSYDGTWPIVTFAINIGGSFALGLLNSASKRARLLLGTGFCGAFTTYGLFAYEVNMSIHVGEMFIAFSYLVASLVVGVLAFAVGSRAVRR